MQASSCFDCALLDYHPDAQLMDVMYWCNGYGKPLDYSFARTPNKCPKKIQYLTEPEIIEFPQYKILSTLYTSCLELSEYLERPFTVLELTEHVQYINKNSLWALLERLVNFGKVEKIEVTTISSNGQTYYSMVYWPVEWSDSAEHHAERSERVS
jgi:hypothetical protein